MKNHWRACLLVLLASLGAGVVNLSTQHGYSNGVNEQELVTYKLEDKETLTVQKCTIAIDALFVNDISIDQRRFRKDHGYDILRGRPDSACSESARCEELIGEFCEMSCRV